jgi:hypothetical protein
MNFSNRALRKESTKSILSICSLRNIFFAFYKGSG